ncbi:MAG: hypothetical protein IH606_00890 [Burkholderiales bacterium]|nr:hypothetical protein [Burkholderiales bacterium]
MSNRVVSPPYDWPQLALELHQFLHLKTTPMGMKLFERIKDMLLCFAAFVLNCSHF